VALGDVYFRCPGATASALSGVSLGAGPGQLAASLDTASEREVQKALDALMSSRTTIAIAHRLTERCGHASRSR
jgi:hypothetical protein